jgi:hypothetical protein
MVMGPSEEPSFRDGRHDVVDGEVNLATAVGALGQGRAALAGRDGTAAGRTADDRADIILVEEAGRADLEAGAAPAEIAGQLAGVIGDGAFELGLGHVRVPRGWPRTPTGPGTNDRPAEMSVGWFVMG